MFVFFSILYYEIGEYSCVCVARKGAKISRPPNSLRRVGSRLVRLVVKPADSAPDPAKEAHGAPPDPLAGFDGAASWPGGRGAGRNGKERGRERMGGERIMERRRG